MDSGTDIRKLLGPLVARLRAAGVQFAEGMSNAEIAQAEEKYNLRVPPDLRGFLQFVLPISVADSDWFPNWRRAIAGDSESHQRIVDALKWPADGICFDVEHNRFWMDEWGPRPGNVEEANASARTKVAQAPRLVPVFSHRYIPSEPDLPGNPVFSVYQTDIIHYGSDLASYLENEFLGGSLPQDITILRPIRFWSRLIEVSGDPLHHRPLDPHSR